MQLSGLASSLQIDTNDSATLCPFSPTYSPTGQPTQPGASTQMTNAPAQKALLSIFDIWLSRAPAHPSPCSARHRSLTAVKERGRQLAPAAVFTLHQSRIRVRFFPCASIAASLQRGQNTSNPRPQGGTGAKGHPPSAALIRKAGPWTTEIGHTKGGRWQNAHKLQMRAPDMIKAWRRGPIRGHRGDRAADSQRRGRSGSRVICRYRPTSLVCGNA